jgi:hypothetical protein
MVKGILLHIYTLMRNPKDFAELKNEVVELSHVIKTYLKDKGYV